MTVRHILLTVAALAVLGLGVYLFVEVRATPATADDQPIADKATRADPPVHRADPEAEPVRDSAPSQVSIPKRGTVPGQDPQGTPQAPTPTPPVADDETKLNGTQVQKLDALMSEANKAYDKGDLDDARAIAAKALALDETNIRMRRIMVSASCIDGNSAEAQKHYLRLPPPDREQMKTRCDRYGVTFNEK